MSRELYSLQAFKEWLETKPPEEEYSYTDGDRCLLYKYFTYIGLPVYSIRPYYWEDNLGKKHTIPDDLESIAIAYPNTFGDAAYRVGEVLLGGGLIGWQILPHTGYHEPSTSV